MRATVADAQASPAIGPPTSPTLYSWSFGETKIVNGIRTITITLDGDPGVLKLTGFQYSPGPSGGNSSINPGTLTTRTGLTASGGQYIEIDLPSPENTGGDSIGITLGAAGGYSQSGTYTE